MAENKDLSSGPQEFDMQDGLSLALSYLEDPSSVPCPRCGSGQIEVVAFLDARAMEDGRATPTTPEGDYTVVLYCHGCGRAAALDLSRDEAGGFIDGPENDGEQENGADFGDDRWAA